MSSGVAFGRPRFAEGVIRLQTYTVVLDGRTSHNGKEYNFGDRLRGLTQGEVARLQRRQVVAAVIDETPPEPELSPLQQLLTSKATDAIDAIGATDDAELLAAVIEHEKRATVRKAAEERLAELEPPKPPASEKDKDKGDGEKANGDGEGGGSATETTTEPTQTTDD